MDEPWYRDGLRFECTRCGDCCAGTPGYVWVDLDEIRRLATHLKVTIEAFGRKYLRRVEDRVSLVEKAGNACVFWDSCAGCTVYEARPLQCRTWPFWTENLADPASWEETMRVCPGSGEGKLYSLGAIRRGRVGEPEVTALSTSPRRGIAPHLRESILQVYDDLASDVARAGPVCDLSGRCCRFTEWDHTLFLSLIEANLLIAEAPPAIRALDGGSTCPWQDQRGHCTAREARPMGCRVYFCDPTYEETGQALSETYLRRLKTLAASHQQAWDYAPLHHHLRAAVEQGRWRGPDDAPRDFPTTAADRHSGLTP